MSKKITVDVNAVLPKARDFRAGLDPREPYICTLKARLYKSGNLAIQLVRPDRWLSPITLTCDAYNRLDDGVICLDCYSPAAPFRPNDAAILEAAGLVEPGPSQAVRGADDFAVGTYRLTKRGMAFAAPAYAKREREFPHTDGGTVSVYDRHGIVACGGCSLKFGTDGHNNLAITAIRPDGRPWGKLTMDLDYRLWRPDVVCLRFDGVCDACKVLEEAGLVKSLPYDGRPHYVPVARRYMRSRRCRGIQPLMVLTDKGRALAKMPKEAEDVYAA